MFIVYPPKTLQFNTEVYLLLKLKLRRKSQKNSFSKVHSKGNYFRQMPDFFKLLSSPGPTFSPIDLSYF